MLGSASYLYRVSSVLKVVDGDTVDCLVDLGFGVSITERFRLTGIDAPELVGASRASAIFARDWLAERLTLGQGLQVESQKHDSFGRWLGRFSDDIGDVNAEMLRLGLAAPYR